MSKKQHLIKKTTIWDLTSVAPNDLSTMIQITET